MTLPVPPEDTEQLSEGAIVATEPTTPAQERGRAHRRVVSERGADGLPVFAANGPAPFVKVLSQDHGAYAAEMWRSSALGPRGQHRA
jgi:hypothetical protein